MSAELAILVGLPRSGKTTYGKRLQEEGYTRICPDEIRLALHGRAFFAPAEDYVWATAKLMTKTLLLGGHKVVIDATNTTRRRRDTWTRMARETRVPVEAIVIEGDPGICHERNEEGESPLPKSVIDRMWVQWEEVEDDEVDVVRVI